MKSVLVVQYSQSGQLTDVAQHVVAPLRDDPNITVTVETLRPSVTYPFPWPFFRFFDTMPECVYLDAPPNASLTVDPAARFDLVILAYQVWFLSPSLPTTAFLQSGDARRLLRDTPVVTLIACRNMWLMAQEQVRELLKSNGARLVGNIALVDEAGSIGSFVATPIWVLTGHRGPHLFGLIPRAGVNPAHIAGARRFGERIRSVLSSERPVDETLLQGLGAVEVNEKLIGSEKTARRSFRIWGKLLRSLGKQGSMARKPVIVVYVAFLLTLILTVVPLIAIVKMLVAPLTRKRIAEQKAYFGAPSGA